MSLGSWHSMPDGAFVRDGGNSTQIETGSWRSTRPVIDYSRCTHCMICWLFCPDSCFKVEEAKIVGIDLDHCKGCGICAVECPRDCVDMVDETKAG